MGMTPKFLSMFWEIEEKYIQNLIAEGAIPVDSRGMIPYDLHNLKELDEAIGRWDEAKSDPVRAAVEKKIGSRALFPTSPGKSSTVVEDSGEFFSDAGRKAFAKAAARGQVRIQGSQINPQASQEIWEREGFLSPEGYAAFIKQTEAGNARIFDPAKRERRG